MEEHKEQAPATVADLLALVRETQMAVLAHGAAIRSLIAMTPDRDQFLRRFDERMSTLLPEALSHAETFAQQAELIRDALPPASG